MQCLVKHISLCLHRRLALLPHVKGLWTERCVELGALCQLVLDHKGAIETGLILEDERGIVLVAPPLLQRPLIQISQWCLSRS